jgi:glycosyltransferase involved in cell wall biosynthesis
MKILYFYQYFTIPAGSYSTRCYEFARRWVKAGDSVTVITSVYDKSGFTPEGFISKFPIEGVDVRVINIRLSQKHGKFFRILTFLAYALMAFWYALTMRADVVLCSSGPLTVGIPGLAARYLRRKPFVFEVRDLWPEGAIQLGVLRNPVGIWLARGLEKACYRAAYRVVALSEGMADWIRQRYGCRNVEVVPNASDNELLDSLREPPQLPEWALGKRLVLYTGTLGLIDDCGQIVELARVLEERGVQEMEVVLIGDGKERAQLEERAVGLKNIHFLGLMPKPEAMRWLKAAHCALFTVKNTPFLATASPNKLFDAFAAGVPVVQTSEGWIKALLEREGCGINVPFEDPHAMADAVLQLAEDEALRARMACNSHRIGREQFDRSLLAEKMRQILKAAMSRKG